MKLSVKVNFDFGKLANKMPTVINDFLNDSYANVVAKDSQEFIRSGQVTPPLAKSTLRKREREGYPKIPLLRTGELTKSLKKSKKGLQMKGYGVLQYNGFTRLGKPHAPSRPFLLVRNFTALKTTFQEAINTALRK